MIRSAANAVVQVGRSCIMRSPAMINSTAPAVAALNQQLRSLHISSPLCKKGMSGLINPSEPKEWPRYNEIVYPPSKPGEPLRPAEVVHYRANVKYSEKKLWPLVMKVRGLSIDEAVKLLSFQPSKGAHILKEILLEAQELAVKDHNVEFKSNLWITDTFSTRAKIIYGRRKHMGPRVGIIHYRYCHIYVRLREGRPPKHYFEPPMTGHEKVEEYINQLRARTIQKSL